jgi:integrase
VWAAFRRLGIVNGDPEVRRKTLGHADAAMTSHYTHIEAQAHRAAAEAVAELVSEA